MKMVKEKGVELKIAQLYPRKGINFLNGEYEAVRMMGLMKVMMFE